MSGEDKNDPQTQAIVAGAFAPAILREVPDMFAATNTRAGMGIDQRTYLMGKDKVPVKDLAVDLMFFRTMGLSVRRGDPAHLRQSVRCRGTNLYVEGQTVCHQRGICRPPSQRPLAI